MLTVDARDDCSRLKRSIGGISYTSSSPESNLLAAKRCIRRKVSCSHACMKESRMVWLLLRCEVYQRTALNGTPIHARSVRTRRLRHEARASLWDGPPLHTVRRRMMSVFHWRPRTQRLSWYVVQRSKFFSGSRSTFWSPMEEIRQLCSERLICGTRELH